MALNYHYAVWWCRNFYGRGTGEKNHVLAQIGNGIRKVYVVCGGSGAAGNRMPVVYRNGLFPSSCLLRRFHFCNIRIMQEGVLFHNLWGGVCSGTSRCTGVAIYIYVFPRREWRIENN